MATYQDDSQQGAKNTKPNVGSTPSNQPKGTPTTTPVSPQKPVTPTTGKTVVADQTDLNKNKYASNQDQAQVQKKKIDPAE